MLKIRLQRTGRRNNPYFRVVLTDSKNGPKSGKFLEILGSYDPKPGVVEFKDDRVKYWISQGAQTSDTVHNFLVDKKIVEGKKINVLPKKSPTKKRNAPDEEPKEDPKAEAASSPADEETPAEAPVESPKEETPKEKAKVEVDSPAGEETPTEDEEKK
ncbi:30S ribosomal protein S16 [Candidatus Wolfebacteria bacterium]|nr:MAG: 30S ribosomal protein S16 [Candidatus Wolfebacteria bacterium]